MNVTIRQKLTSLPKEPGVYFMKGAKGQVLYVGKAKELKSRVSSYFNSSKDHSPKTKKLVKEIIDFEVMLVKTEVDALLLERTLIKHHQPPFNILLRDDKEYPYIRIDFASDWPRLEVVRRRLDDKADYFGPFSATGSLRTSIEAIKRVFPLIRCNSWEFEHAKRVCNYYHMKMCLGPCVLPVAKDTYKEMLRDAMALLAGNNDLVIQRLLTKMQHASDRELYELAASYRDQLKAIEILSERQTVMVAPDIDGDVIALQQSIDMIAIHVGMIRSGRLIGGDSFTFDASLIDEQSNILEQFLIQYYDHHDAPPRIILNRDIANSIEISAVIKKSESRTTEIRSLRNLRAPWPDLMDIAQKNAVYAHDEAVRNQDRKRSTLEAIQSTLNLTVSPRRIECIDISNLQGTAIVASNVCFIDANPAKKYYRSYNVQSVKDSPDDYASIHEIVLRRLERGIRDDDLPDLLVIDGGRGQLESALKALGEFPGLQLAIVAIAKSKVIPNTVSKAFKVSSQAPKHTMERVFLPGQALPVSLVPGTPTFRVLTQIRDEAHRFAITKHRNKRKTLGERSLLEEIDGVGPKTRQALLKKFGSIENIKDATVASLQEIKGVSEDLARLIKSKCT